MLWNVGLQLYLLPTWSVLMGEDEAGTLTRLMSLPSAT